MLTDARTPSTALLLAALLALVAALAPAPASARVIRCSSSNAYVPGVPLRCEQARYARETIALSHTDFMARKQDFTINGCTNGPGGCRKPAPYNEFDWTTDGCSGPTGQLPPAGSWSAIFREPCELHDFGYRNFGKGLKLQGTEVGRHRVDRAFRREMLRVCSTWSPGLQRRTCRAAANTMYSAVVFFPGNYWGFV